MFWLCRVKLGCLGEVKFVWRPQCAPQCTFGWRGSALQLITLIVTQGGHMSRAVLEREYTSLVAAADNTMADLTKKVQMQKKAEEQERLRK